MKVGIITFHWATNYGAVLQAFALQEAVKELGCQVEIINYKPSRYDNNLWTFFRYRKFLHFNRFLIQQSKERKIAEFREKHLNLSGRFKTLKALQSHAQNYDILITGSDQVLNYSFLEYGEKGGSTAYFLDFGTPEAKRISYAASFGVTSYPDRLLPQTAKLLKPFVAVSARESTGKDIFTAMGRKDSITVPDPTLLHSKDFYTSSVLSSLSPLPQEVRGYFLRQRENAVERVLAEIGVNLIKDESIEEWINAIRSSSHVVTNSFHGVAFCVIYNVPFTVILQTKENKGMNDRFYTLLGFLGLTDRIVSEKEFSPSHISFNHNWDEINQKVNSYRKIGIDFLEKTIKNL